MNVHELRKEYDRRFRRLLLEYEYPITTKFIERKVGCSRRTALRLIDRIWSGHWCWYPDGHGNYYMLYFPISWNFERVKLWLNNHHSQGRSTALVYTKEKTRGN